MDWPRFFPKRNPALPSGSRSLDCPAHGTNGIGLVCDHIARAIDRGDKVGFFWGDDTDNARPDAWCAQCEQALVALDGASSESWFRDARFRVFCERCWDEARAICGAL